MADVFDVAAYILAQRGPMSAWKLQKLAYYSQAWSLVWDDRPLFPEPIQAWANGPVCPALYNQHRGHFMIGADDLHVGRKSNLRKSEIKTIDIVLAHYGKKTGQYLSELTHQERPWKEARRGLKPGERGSRVIQLDTMAEYYGGL